MNDIFVLGTAFVVGFGASYFAQWPPAPHILWRTFELRRRRQRHCYTLPTGRTYLVPSVSSDDVSRYLSEHDMACVEAVAAMLRASGYREGDDFQVFWQDPKCDTVPESVRTENLVLVCGPRRNRMTESILRDFPNLVQAVQLEVAPSLAFAWHGQRYIGTDQRDYALVAIKKNPYNPKRRIVFLFGLRSMGTRGAGSFYAKPEWAYARAQVADRLEMRTGEIEMLLSVDYTPDYREIKKVEVVP
jgi:hypothetical protein